MGLRYSSTILLLPLLCSMVKAQDSHCGAAGDPCAKDGSDWAKACCEGLRCVPRTGGDGKTNDFKSLTDYHCKAEETDDEIHIQRLQQDYPHTPAGRRPDVFLQKWRGREEQMFHVLDVKYKGKKDEL